MHRTHQNKRRGIEWGLTNILDDLDYADMQSKLEDLEREAGSAGIRSTLGKLKECPLELKTAPNCGWVQRIRNAFINLFTLEASCLKLDVQKKTLVHALPLALSNLRTTSGLTVRKLTRRLKVQIFGYMCLKRGRSLTTSRTGSKS
ncbi:unnamed protein product [Pieris macdunnoughi]|uniref:Uncharacterized protein n=1 Tax=Pieris macdunnoughi TaxID=345717 RepID=A0A821QKB3_9NEOP|nr:unnamed protein product [Pieris macdunnoughi]